MLSEVTYRDIERVANTMRASDRAEIMSASGSQPLECLEQSVDMSRYARTISANGSALAIVGLVVADGVGIPWLLGSDSIEDNKKTFYASAKEALSQMIEIAPKMQNFVQCKNSASVNFLKRLGFDILPARAFGVNAEDFHKFERGFSHV